MVKLVPMLGAIMGQVKTPPGQDKKRAVKPRGNRTTKGEKSVTEPAQQHGELASAAEPVKLTDSQQMKEHARHEKRRATESWISGHMSTEEHSAVHARAKHVLSGKRPEHFKGKSGERKFRGLR